MNGNLLIKTNNKMYPEHLKNIYLRILMKK